MSASKLLKRIVASEDMKEKTSEAITLKHLHDHTFGIATDPLCQFAVVFSALVHDVGHPGVPNTRLAVEEPLTAEKYSNRSIAEQRSLDVAFDLLNLPNFQNLRKCIYATESECTRFRQLVVNSILATDIADKDMKALRDSRWDVAFQNSSVDADEDKWMDRKATIVIEHVIQASDVAHTMQHFVVYQKWNERLFQELYFAFRAGRMEKDPSLGWYGGEIWFFDNYIIPLAHKLKDCGVFGVSSDEYLHYATQNRREWEEKGHSILEAMISRAEALYTKKEAIAEAKTSNKKDTMVLDYQC
jgi:3'5'-cyclic nucleotide phosphodiesterase